MNTGNTIEPAKGSSHEMPLGDLNSLESELDIIKQPEPSTSTSKTRTPKSKVSKCQRKKELLDKMEALSELIEPIIYEQNIKKSRLFDIKIACETLAEELDGRILSDKDVIDTLNSLIASDDQKSDKQKALKKILKLEQSMEKISRRVQAHLSGDKHFADALEDFTESKLEFISGKHVIESLCEDIKKLLDAMLGTVTSLDQSVKH